MIGPIPNLTKLNLNDRLIDDLHMFDIVRPAWTHQLHDLHSSPETQRLLLPPRLLRFVALAEALEEPRIGSLGSMEGTRDRCRQGAPGNPFG